METPFRLSVFGFRASFVIRHSSFVILSCLLIWWPTALSQTETNAEPPPPRTLSLTTVFEVERAAEADIIVLRNGEEIHGEVLNQSIMFHTLIGSLVLETHMLAGIDLDSTPQHLDTLIAANQNRFTGYWNGVLRFSPPGGEPREFKKNDIRRIIFRMGNSERTMGLTRQFILLDNSNLISGRILTDEIKVSTTSGVRSLLVGDLETVRFIKASREVQILLRNGDELIGFVKTQSISVELDVGTVITLNRNHIKTLYCRSGFIPTTVRHTLASHPQGLSDAAPPPIDSLPKDLVWIPPGTFLMGSPSNEAQRGADEGPQTEVTITRGFWMARYETTQAEYLDLMGNNPSTYQGDLAHPVEKVSWYEAVDYCVRFTELQRDLGTLPEGYVYRLPTEAEWEYACRAGTTTRFNYGEDVNQSRLGSHAWFIRNSDSSTHPVGLLLPNPWDLYDMHGNVWEWCHDLWNYAYPGGHQADFTGATEGWLRVARGGSWLYDTSYCRSANRDDYGPDNRCSDIGFRVVLAPVLESDR